VKHRFEVTITTVATLELDDAVLAAVDDDWRKQMYAHIHTPEDVAEFVGFNMILRDLRLRSIDGFANLENSLASVVPGSVEHDVEATLQARARKAGKQ